MIHVIAQIQLKPGTRDRFLEEFHKLVPAVHKEAGCLEYGPTVDATTELDNQHRDENLVTIVEKWESLSHLMAHLTAPHMVEYRPRVKAFVEQSTLHILEPA